MAGRDVHRLLRALELDQRRAHVLLGRAGAVLLLVTHLKDDGSRRRDARGASFSRALHGINELVGDFAARSIRVVVEQRLKVLLARVLSRQPTRNVHGLW